MQTYILVLILVLMMEPTHAHHFRELPENFAAALTMNDKTHPISLPRCVERKGKAGESIFFQLTVKSTTACTAFSTCSNWS